MTPCSRLLLALPTLWREADVISLHCPLTADPAGLPNARPPAACRRGMIVVNTARGGRADQAALLAAVRSGQVAAAGPDSFAVEPMGAAHPFRGEPGFRAQPAHRRRHGRRRREDGRGRGAERAAAAAAPETRRSLIWVMGPATAAGAGHADPRPAATMRAQAAVSSRRTACTGSARGRATASPDGPSGRRGRRARDDRQGRGERPTGCTA